MSSEDILFSDDSIRNFQRITGIIVSTILYVRNFFNESAYFCTEFGRLKLRLLSSKNSDVRVLKIIEYLANSFHAFRKKYMRKLAMEIFEHSRPESPVEVYEFNYEYNRLTSSDFSREECEKILLDLLNFLENLSPFSKRKKFFVSFKIHYYPETPNEYNPEEFIPYESSLQSESDEFSRRDDSFRSNIVVENSSFRLKVNCERENSDYNVSPDPHNSLNSRIRSLFGKG